MTTISWSVDLRPTPGDDFLQDLHPIIKEYHGTVIGSYKPLFGEPCLIVACIDKQVREVEISKVETA